MNKTRKKIRTWDDDYTPYGTYEGNAGNPDDWAKAFQFAKMTREQALGLLITVVETPYEILGLQNNATEVEIKSAMRKLVMVHHPDKGGNAETFNKIMAAYTVLTT